LTARPLVIAHRGASGERRENTVEAFELAVEQGADMIETDLHRTVDGAIVVVHDGELPGVGAIGAASRARLRGAAPAMPSLDEVLDAFGERIDFNLELKIGPRGPYAGLEESTFELLARRGLGPRTLLSSFDDRVLARMRVLEPEARIGVLVGRRSGGWIERCEALGAEAVHFGRRMASAEAIDRAHAAGLRVYVYTVDEPDEMRALIGRGADGLFTNWPARMRELLGGLPRGEAPSGPAE